MVVAQAELPTCIKPYTDWLLPLASLGSQPLGGYDNAWLLNDWEAGMDPRPVVTVESAMTGEWLSQWPLKVNQEAST
jgi:hypothetical protein